MPAFSLWDTEISPWNIPVRFFARVPPNVYEECFLLEELVATLLARPGFVACVRFDMPLQIAVGRE